LYFDHCRKHRDRKEIMTYQVRAYQDSDWEQVRTFIANNWSSNHPNLDKTLFDWQYRGFGNENQKIKFLLLIYQDTVIGIRGVIPGLYQVPVEQNHMVVLQGGSLSMWMVQKQYRGHKLGLMLHMEAQKSMSVITGAGSNPATSVPIYIKNGFDILDTMNRYVMPLKLVYHQLLSQQVSQGEVAEWIATQPITHKPLAPVAPDIHALACLWQETTFPLGIFSLFRNADFWRWRYVESVGFDYLFWGDPKGAGIVVGRLERIIAPDNMGLDRRKVFRIIELVPNDKAVWQGEINKGFIELIQGVIEWARQQGCLAVDFYCSTGRFGRVLTDVGFKKQVPNLGTPLCSLALLFQPLVYVGSWINALYRIEIKGKGLIYPKFQNTYMVKSENDMDRPTLRNIR